MRWVRSRLGTANCSSFPVSGVTRHFFDFVTSVYLVPQPAIDLGEIREIRADTPRDFRDRVAFFSKTLLAAEVSNSTGMRSQAESAINASISSRSCCCCVARLRFRSGCCSECHSLSLTIVGLSQSEPSVFAIECKGKKFPVGIHA